MTDETKDPLFARLLDAARDYNRPPLEVPRERMWAEIRAARERARAEQGRSRHRWLRIAGSIAAVLVFGIVIGRLYERMLHRTSSVALQPPAALDSGAKPGSEGATDTNTESSGDNMAYRLAVLHHFAGTEAMLTAFRTSARNGQVDEQMSAWARNLLRQTRLLAASPAATQDPTMKRLLNDLELVLVQIANYTTNGTHDAQEFELIEHSIERRGVITKLRTTIPAGLRPAGT
jgi:hypothetical protein